MEKRKNIYWYDKSMKRQRIMTTVIGAVGAVLLTVLTAALIILDLGYKSYKVEAKDKIASLEKDNSSTTLIINAADKEIKITLFDNGETDSKAVCICSENNFPCRISDDDLAKFNVTLNDFID